eukprot:jgi/Mesvir1/29419/Mv24150-RA.1
MEADAPVVGAYELVRRPVASPQKDGEFNIPIEEPAKSKYGRQRLQDSACTCRFGLFIFLALVIIIPAGIWYHNPASCAEGCQSCISHSPVNASFTNSSNGLRLNQLQNICTHNSYHKPGFFSNFAAEWALKSRPLTWQLEEGGVRCFELDIHFDSRRKPPPVYHIRYLDQKSTCKCLLGCLSIIKAWSEQHPWHVTLFIDLEVKFELDAWRPCDQPFTYLNSNVTGEPFDQHDAITAFDDLRNHILTTIPAEKIITPVDVRGSHASVQAALLASHGSAWPSVDQGRGKIIFFLSFWRRNWACRKFYQLSKAPELIFERLRSSQLKKQGIQQAPHTAFVETSKKAEVASYLANGFMVLNNDLNNTNRGAQILKTDDPLSFSLGLANQCS